MSKPTYSREKVLAALNRILENELAGVVRYTHYSLMVFGYHRIPITSWLREQAKESLMHAERAGEMITHLGGHPSLGIGPLLESHNHDIGQILEESYYTEKDGLELYKDLLALVENKDTLLEEYARELIVAEANHIDEVDKMLRKPGEVTAAHPADAKAPKRKR